MTASLGVGYKPNNEARERAYNGLRPRDPAAQRPDLFWPFLISKNSSKNQKTPSGVFFGFTTAIYAAGVFSPSTGASGVVGISSETSGVA